MARKKLIASLPTTVALLERIKHPRKKTLVDRIERYVLWTIAAIMLALLGLAGASTFGALPAGFVSATFVVLVACLIVAFLVWAVSQMVEAVLAIKAGFRPAAETIDEVILRERDLISELALCRKEELRERSKHLELRARRLSRRASLVTVLTAIGVVIINVFESGARASLWSKFESVTLYVYSASLGLLVGSVVLWIFVGRLEQISGLLMLAAERLDRQ